MNSIATCLNWNEKGIFSTVIIAILILILLGVLAQIIAAQKLQNETIESIITTKQLTSQRANFEYNIANVLKDQLQYELEHWENTDPAKVNIDNNLNTVLQDYGITEMPNTFLEQSVTSEKCLQSMCGFYTFLKEIKKTITYNNKTMEMKIPKDFTIEGSVSIP